MDRTREENGALWDRIADLEVEVERLQREKAALEERLQAKVSQ